MWCTHNNACVNIMGLPTQLHVQYHLWAEMKMGHTWNSLKKALPYPMLGEETSGTLSFWRTKWSIDRSSVNDTSFFPPRQTWVLAPVQHYHQQETAQLRTSIWSNYPILLNWSNDKWRIWGTVTNLSMTQWESCELHVNCIWKITGSTNVNIMPLINSALQFTIKW